MFAEPQPQAKGGAETWFERRARRHPRVFTAGLVVLAIAVTIGLLLKTDYAIVLYQGF